MDESSFSGSESSGLWVIFCWRWGSFILVEIISSCFLKLINLSGKEEKSVIKMQISKPLLITVVINCKQFWGICLNNFTWEKKCVYLNKKSYQWSISKKRDTSFLTPLLCDNAADGRLLSCYYWQYDYNRSRRATSDAKKMKPNCCVS